MPSEQVRQRKQRIKSLWYNVHFYISKQSKNLFYKTSTMKYSRFCVLLFGFAIFIASCQKELSYEAGLGKGTLKKDASGECLPVNVNGTYNTDTLLKPTVNFVDIQVNVSEPGTYSIRTDSLNGYSFSGAGYFAVQGLNTVRLIGSGKPIAAGADMFTVKFDTSVCQFNVTVTGGGGGGGGGSNIFTFECPTNPTFSGTYQAGTSTAGSSVKINVTSPNGGSYSITTTTSNGVTFSGSGILLASTNLQSVTLSASGTPTAGGNFTYTLSGSGTTSTCTFVQSYGSSAMVSTDSIVANIDGILTSFKIRDSARLDTTTLPGYAGIGIKGESNAAGDEKFGLAVAKSGTSLTTGTFTVNQFPAAFVGASYANLMGSYIAKSDTNIPPAQQNPGFSVTISSITSTRVIGTFSGRLLENGGMGPGFKTVTNGVFSVTIYP